MPVRELLSFQTRAVRARWDTEDVSLQALDSPRHVARGLDRLTRIKRPAPGGAGGSACSHGPMAVHGTIPVDFATLAEGLGLVRSGPHAVLDDPSGVCVAIRCSAYAETLLIPSAPRILQATAFTLLAAGVAALAFAMLPLPWFISGVLLCGTLALVAEVLARRGAARTKHDEAARAVAARLAELKQTSETLKARERAVESVQMEVLEGFRREHGL